MKNDPFQFIQTKQQSQVEPQADYRDLEAMELYCPKCGRAVPVRKFLLLVLPEGDKYEYRCQSENGYFPSRYQRGGRLKLYYLRRINPRNTQCMDACPAVFKRGGYNFRLPPLKVRDLRLDLGKNS